MSDSKFKFSGHQTFAFRYGWLEKGVRAVAEHSDIFSRDDALIVLGVGKNMVASIRHWCQVTQLVEPNPEVPRNTGRYLRVTDLARQLLLEPGWDPFLEDDASLWLVHWLLVSNQNVGTSWKLLFSRFHRPDFTRRELADFVASFVEKESLRVGENVVARDVDCLIRTYANSANGKKAARPEDTFECPFLELDLIQPSPDGELFRFAIGPKPSLVPSVFAFALAQFVDQESSSSKTLSVQKCLYGEGSPGQAFKLDENSLIGYIEDLEEITGGAMVIDETAGLKQVYFRRSLDPMQILKDYYEGSMPK